MYRTGDLVRWREEGTLEFLRRSDAQVKVRGFRVELGEIETALASAPGVRTAAVVLREDRANQPILVGYIVPTQMPGPEAPAMREHLQAILPEFMIPTAFVSLPTLPLSSSGKLDRRALPAPSFDPAPEDYTPPRDDLERILAEIIGRVLRLERVGVHDRFFQMGGNSLTAIQVISRVRDLFKAEVTVASFFEHATVAGLAASLRANPAANAQVEKVASARARIASLLPEERQRLLAQKRDAAPKT
jgi:nonribosomal peptide synthetase DhbF